MDNLGRESVMFLSDLQQRELLEDYTRSLSDSDWLDRVWIRLEVNQNSDFCLDDVFHLFFDDTLYAEEPERYIGKSLLNIEEVAAVRRMVVALDALLIANGDYLTDAEYLRTPQWPAVHEVAKALHALIVANDARMAAP